MNIGWETRELHTKRPFGIARWTHSVYPRTFISVEHGGSVGRGEAAPNAFYGETRATVEAVLPSLAQALLDPWNWEGLERGFAERFPFHHPSVKCALESAALEWCAVCAGVPVWRLLGLSDRPAPESSFTVSIAALPEMRRQTRDALAHGHNVLKVKLSTENDEAILAALREEAPAGRLRVDANAAWSRQHAQRMLEAADVEFVEQPLAPDDLEGHAQLRRASRVPIVADESLHRVSDVVRLAGAFDALNLKLAKLGGPLQTLKALRTARALGLSVMLGRMIESSLGISAAVHLAGLADWVDLDGALLLAEDPSRDCLGRPGGSCAPPCQVGV